MKRILKQYLLLLLLIGGLTTAFIATNLNRAYQKSGAINIGCKNFTEQQIVGEMVSLLLEEKYHKPVNRMFNLDGTLVAFEALLAKDLDLVMEYSGTMLIEILHEKDFQHKDSRWIDEAFSEKLGLRWVHPTGHSNTYTLLMSEDAACETIEELAQFLQSNPKARIAVSHEFHARPEFQLLQKEYPFLEKVKDLDECFIYLTVANKDIDIGVGYGTDGRIEKYHLKALKDSKGAIPEYRAAFAVRKEIYEERPELAHALTDLENTLTDEAMRALNNRVDSDHYSPRDVAREFLVTKGLLSKTP